MKGLFWNLLGSDFCPELFLMGTTPTFLFFVYISVLFQGYMDIKVIYVFCSTQEYNKCIFKAEQYEAVILEANC